MKDQRSYIAIDLKSFYASVECVDRGLDPLTTHLVVADPSRTEKTICLAVSPALKQYGIGGRARLFEVVQRVRQVNFERMNKVEWRKMGKSFDDNQLREHPDWELDYIVAPPRMAHYIEVSNKVNQVYLRYVAPEDMHCYSVDEVMIDVTGYLSTYKMTARELAMTMIRDILKTTGITATAGIGTNLYLAKVAMDIVAKHAEADENGVRIGELDEMSYRRTLWDYRPLTSFWRVGRGLSTRLAEYGIDTMGKLARQSVRDEELLYKLFGVNAELLIDHAWGWEPCTIAEVKAYKPESNSFSRGQVLQHAYDSDSARVVVKEMAESMALNLVSRRMVTNQIVLSIGYDVANMSSDGVNIAYKGKLHIDRYGRQVPQHAHGTANLERRTSSTRLITEAVMELYDRIVNPQLLIRRLNLTTNKVVAESVCEKNELSGKQLDLFTDYEAMDRQREQENERLEKERRMQEAQLSIRRRFGKNAILRGLNFADGATARERNAQIGGHKA